MVAAGPAQATREIQIVRSQNIIAIRAQLFIGFRAPRMAFSRFMTLVLSNRIIGYRL